MTMFDKKNNSKKDGPHIPVPTGPQAAWHDMEIGLFVHFNMFTYLPGEISAEIFQPARLDTDQWMEAAVAIGAKYAVLTAKHGCGFCVWPTDVKDYDYSVKHTSWKNGKGDIVADFVKSCRKYNVKPGIYYNVATNQYMGVKRHKLNDGKGGETPEEHRRYLEVCEQQLTELWSRYGELFEVWFDGGVMPVGQGGPDILPLLDKYQPNAVVFQGPPGTRHLIRWVGNERGVAPYPCWSTVREGTSEDGTKEKDFAGTPDGNFWAPAEVDVPLRGNVWQWNPNQEHLVASLEHLVKIYYESVGRNCNLLLNAGPDRNGLITEIDMDRYREFGREVQRRFKHPLAETSGRGEKIMLELPEPQAVNQVVLMEDISHGERVRKYVVEGLLETNNWIRLCEGTVIGHKHIQQIERRKISAVRLHLTESVTEPIIRKVSLFNVQ